MGYIADGPDALGGLGCGAMCACASCRAGSSLAESYIEDDADEGDETKNGKGNDALGHLSSGRNRSMAYMHGFGQAPAQAPAPPRLAARCYELRLTVPSTYEALEAAVERWIATCVQSRTLVGGSPAHRERSLVRGNATLRQVWERIRDAAGKTMAIRAEYIWGPNRVESIKFSAPLGVYNFPEEVIEGRRPDTIERIIDRALQLLPDAARHGVPLSAHQVSRIRCWLQMLKNPGTDDKFLTAAMMLQYKNANGRMPKNYSSVKQWLLPEDHVRRRYVASDQAVLTSVRRIDEEIVDGRSWLNREFATQGAALHHTVKEMNEIIARLERDTRSVYNCYCKDSGRC
jgi:hypothetical protein